LTRLRKRIFPRETPIMPREGKMEYMDARDATDDFKELAETGAVREKFAGSGA
jgi:hypothetical protein